jgi:hypothetical protein
MKCVICVETDTMVVSVSIMVGRLKRLLAEQIIYKHRAQTS